MVEKRSSNVKLPLPVVIENTITVALANYLKTDLSNLTKDAYKGLVSDLATELLQSPDFKSTLAKAVLLEIILLPIRSLKNFLITTGGAVIVTVIANYFSEKKILNIAIDFFLKP